MAAALVKDEWVTAAMSNDEVVVELLLRLKQAKEAVRAVDTADNPVLTRFRWGIRKRRSRSLRCGGGSLRKEVDSAVNAGGSPTTPFSWSGGSASPSTTVDGFEETSYQATCSISAGSRSKVLVTNDMSVSSKSSTKRKQAFSELKDEERLLLNERRHLKKEIASLRATFQQQIARNENLKRIKLDLNSADSDKETSDQANERLQSTLNQAPSMLPRNSSVKDHLNSDSPIRDKTETASSSGGFFMLPDLNMTPAEDDSAN